MVGIKKNESGIFSLKSYVVAIGEAILIDGHNILSNGELMVITQKNPLIIWSTVKVSWVWRCPSDVNRTLIHLSINTN